MHPLAMTLRILLVVALILNGIGGAVAGVSGLAPVTATSSHAAVTGSDCGGHQATAEAGGDSGPDAASHCCPSAGDSDCSDDPRCLQACTHACMAVSPRFSIGVQVNAARAPHPLMAGHPSPPTRSPIRPPIA